MIKDQDAIVTTVGDKKAGAIGKGKPREINGSRADCWKRVVSITVGTAGLANSRVVVRLGAGHVRLTNLNVRRLILAIRNNIPD